ncbi:unnamed protein product, partial [Effrenium voratum]
QADKVNEKKQDPADSVSTAAFSAAEHSEDCSPALRVAHPVTRQATQGRHVCLARPCNRQLVSI